MHGNALRDACDMVSLKYIFFLDLGFNYLRRIHSNCFSHLNQLKILNIHNNWLVFVEKLSFGNLTNLYFLNLSNNPLSNFPVLLSTQFKLLAMTNVSLRQIDIESLMDIDV